MIDQHETNDELSNHETAHPEAVEPVIHSELSIPLAEPATAPQEPTPDPELVYEVLTHNEAVSRPRPYTFRERDTGALVTLN